MPVQYTIIMVLTALQYSCTLGLKPSILERYTVPGTVLPYHQVHKVRTSVTCTSKGVGEFGCAVPKLASTATVERLKGETLQKQTVKNLFLWQSAIWTTSTCTRYPDLLIVLPKFLPGFEIDDR
jgi:hypothetical protein